MRKHLVPGEQVIVTTRPQPRKLAGAAVVFVMAPALAAFAAAWVVRGEPSRLVPAVDSGWTPWLVGACGLVVLGAWLGYCLPRLLRWHGTRYILTSRRLLARSGVVGRREQQVNLASVRHLTVHETVLQRLLRSGNIFLETGYQGGLTFQDVPEAGRFRDFILDAIAELHGDPPRSGQVVDYDGGADRAGQAGPGWGARQQDTEELDAWRQDAVNQDAGYQDGAYTGAGYSDDAGQNGGTGRLGPVRPGNGVEASNGPDSIGPDNIGAGGRAGNDGQWAVREGGRDER